MYRRTDEDTVSSKLCSELSPHSSIVEKRRHTFGSYCVPTRKGMPAAPEFTTLKVVDNLALSAKPQFGQGFLCHLDALVA